MPSEHAIKELSMEIKQYLAHDLLEANYESLMPKAISEKFYSYVYNHTNFLEKVDPASAKRELHYVLAVQDDAKKIFGYRYFYWEKSMNRFHFFAVVMDESIKRQGYAIKTFLEGVKVANKLGVKNFYSTINSETSVERDGLINAYKRACQDLHKKGNQFEMVYLDKGFTMK
jgi:hypothetical protein